MGKIKTQIGGKFSRYNTGLFDFKRHLIDAGIDVIFPTGDSIVKTVNGIDLSYDPDLISSTLYDVECEYLKSIRQSSFHAVYNVFLDNKGYIGKSTGMELAYAMLHQVPIVCLYEPSFQKSIDHRILEILREGSGLFKVIRIDTLNQEHLLNELENISKLRIDYNLSVESEIIIMSNVENILNEYRVKDEHNS